MKKVCIIFKSAIIAILIIIMGIIVYLGFTETKYKAMFGTTYKCKLQNDIEFETENPDLSMNYFDLSIDLTYQSINKIGKDCEIHLLNGRNKLADGEIIISKWLYLSIYCSEEGPFYISNSVYEKIVRDQPCLERDMLLIGTPDQSMFFSPDWSAMTARSPLVASSLVRYGLLDLEKIEYKDYYLVLGSTSCKIIEKREDCFTIAGYYVSPLDALLGTEVQQTKDYDRLIMYFAYDQIAYGYDNWSF